MALKMTNQEIELFFKKALSDVYTRPKRPIRRQIRIVQKSNISIFNNVVNSGKTGILGNFFNLLRKNGTTDEGTPV